MFEDKTVLILGAGACRPYGFPTSGELRRIILGDSRLIFQDLGFANAEELAHEQEQDFLRSAYNERRYLQEFREVFRDSQRISIDSFIAGHPNAERLGHIARGAIATVILRCEAHATLDGNWYQWLLEFLLAEGRDFSSGLLSIVTFNYDRSLEYYLLKAFKNAFGLDDQATLEMLSRIEFVHVYGSVGPLFTGVASGVRLGDTNAAFQVSDNIGLVAPRSPAPAQERARRLLNEAQRIIFLGFGFWKENLDTLCGEPYVASPIWNSKHVFASCYKLWRSTLFQANARFSLRPDQKPLINWGTTEQDVLGFVTGWNLKATRY